MEDKIFDIVTDLIRDDISKDEAIDKLLVLYNVSHRREQLIDFLTWYIHKSDMTEGAFSIKLIVDEYLKSINCG